MKSEERSWFDPPVVSEMIDQASAFVSEMERLVKI